MSHIFLGFGHCLSVLLLQHDGSQKGGPLDYTSGILNINVIDVLNINKK